MKSPVSKIKDLSNWKEIVCGFFVYEISEHEWYELAITRAKDNMILAEFRANLYIVRDYLDDKCETCFERFCRVYDKPLNFVLDDAAAYYCSTH